MTTTDHTKPSPIAPMAHLAQAAGTYREQPVTGPLSEHFRCAWAHRMPDLGPASIVVVPDGCVDVIWSETGLRVAGPDRVYQVETLTHDASIIGYRFQPGVAARWLGVPLSALVNQRVPLAELWGREADLMADEISGARSLRAKADRFASALLRQALAVSPAEEAVRAVHGMFAIGAERGEALVPRLTAELGVSERTIRRHFDVHFGYGPKALDRILRFQRFVGYLRSDHARPLAQLALLAGYTDQAHLTRECRRLADRTAGELAHQLTQRPPAHNGQSAFEEPGANNDRGLSPARERELGGWR